MIEENKLGARPLEFLWVSVGVISVPFVLIWACVNPSDWPWLVAGILFGKFFVGMVGKNIAFHRYICHRSFKTTKWKHYFLLFANSFSTNSPLTAATVHRYHHKQSDTDRDPHSPKQYGFWNAVLMWRGRSVQWKKSMPLPVDLMRDKTLMWLHKNCITVYGLYALICFLISWKLAVFVLFFATGLIAINNSIIFIGLVHMNIPGSYRNFATPDHSYNNKIVEFFSTGEGYHNNHHMYPGRYNMAIKDHEFDLAGWIVEKVFIDETK
jgi:fatty-acid desaturase